MSLLWAVILPQSRIPAFLSLFDSPAGILSEMKTIKEEINIFRRRGCRICEFTKLTFYPGIRLKQVLAPVFQVAFSSVGHIQHYWHNEDYHKQTNDEPAQTTYNFFGPEHA